MWTLSSPVKEDCLIALDVYTHITDDMQRTITANINHCTGKAAPQEDASQPGQETDPAMAEKPRMTDSKPYVGRSASPAPATSLKSTNISLRDAIPPNGSTARHTPTMPTHIPARSARRS